jgi:hypothetical protein
LNVHESCLRSQGRGDIPAERREMFWTIELRFLDKCFARPLFEHVLAGVLTVPVVRRLGTRTGSNDKYVILLHFLSVKGDIIGHYQTRLTGQRVGLSSFRLLPAIA